MNLGLNLSVQYPTNNDDIENVAARGMKYWTASASDKPRFFKIEIILKMKPVLNAELLAKARAAMI